MKSFLKFKTYRGDNCGWISFKSIAGIIDWARWNESINSVQLGSINALEYYRHTVNLIFCGNYMVERKDQRSYVMFSNS